MARGIGITRLSTVCILLAAAPCAVVAQGTTSSALMGTVRDPSGKPLAGALVRITSSAMIGGEKTMRTSENGGYRFPVLPPGPYRIVVESIGLTTLSGSQTLELGRTSSVNWKFQAAASATVEVVASAETVDAAPASTTVNFRSEDLEKVSLRRDLISIANLTPGINNGAAWGGDRTNSNAYLLDGINVGDPSTGQQWIQVNPDWFEEVQIGGLGAPAEYGGFSGGYFNALVKKGGNDLKGDVTTYYQGENWGAVKYIPDPNVDNKLLKVQANKNTDYSASVGGPILKDKVWYFVSAESLTDTSFPVGSPVSSMRRTDRFLGNLTWQVNSMGTLSAFLDLDNVTGEHRGASSIRTEVATNKQESPNATLGISWLQAIGSSMALTVRASGYTGKDNRKAYNGEQPPLYVDGGVPNTAAYQGFAGYSEFANAYQVQENQRSRMGLLMALDYYKSGLFTSGDQHAFKFGLEREHAKDVEKTRFPGAISYNAFIESDVVYTDFVQIGGGLNLDTKLDRTACFLQDTWTVNDHLSLRPGVRVERFEGGDLWNNTVVAPRIGITWTLDQAKTGAIKLHWGKYYDGLSAAYFDRAVPGAYPLENTYYWEDTGLNPIPMTAANLLNPQSIPYTTADFRADRTEASHLDPNVKQPYTVEWLVAYDQKLGKDWTVGFSYANRKGKDLLVRIDRADLGSLLPDVLNPLTNQNFPAFNRPSAHHNYLITNSDEAKRDYTALTFTVNGNLTKNWDMNASYTRADLKGNLAKSNGYDSRFEWIGSRYNAEGKLPGYSDDEFKIRTSYRMPWDMLVSANFAFTTGEHFTRYVRTGRLANREYYTLYAETLGTQTYDPRRLLNVKVSQRLKLSKQLHLELFGDVFNVLNSDNVLSQITRLGTDYTGQPLAIEEPRTFRLGARLSF